MRVTQPSFFPDGRDGVSNDESGGTERGVRGRDNGAERDVTQSGGEVALEAGVGRFGGEMNGDEAAEERGQRLDEDGAGGCGSEVNESDCDLLPRELEEDIMRGVVSRRTKD
jgi:hypothetical protein